MLCYFHKSQSDHLFHNNAPLFICRLKGRSSLSATRIAVKISIGKKKLTVYSFVSRWYILDVCLSNEKGDKQNILSIHYDTIRYVNDSTPIKENIVLKMYFFEEILEILLKSNLKIFNICFIIAKILKIP